MFEKLEIIQLASGVTRHAATRQSVIARNVANADTPGYRSQEIADFSTAIRQSRNGFTPFATRPEHVFVQGPMKFRPAESAEPSSKPNGNSVSLEKEMVRAVETRQQHQMAVSVYKTSLDILRSSLGRR